MRVLCYVEIDLKGTFGRNHPSVFSTRLIGLHQKQYSSGVLTGGELGCVTVLQKKTPSQHFKNNGNGSKPQKEEKHQSKGSHLRPTLVPDRLLQNSSAGTSITL